MRPPLILVLLAGGCAASHAGGDAGAGATLPDAGAPSGDPRLGPPCVEPLPALRPVQVSAGVTDLEAAAGFGIDAVAALGAGPDGALLLVEGAEFTSADPAAWGLTDLDLEAHARVSRVLEVAPESVGRSGAVLRRPDGSALVAWASLLTSDRGYIEGAEMSLARVRGHAAPEPLAAVQRTSEPFGEQGYRVMLVGAGDRAIAVTRRDGAVVASDLADHELARMELAAGDGRTSWLRAAAVDDRRVVLLWRVYGGPIFAAVARLDEGTVDARVEVAPGTLTGRAPSLLVHEGSVYVAYFEDVLEDLWSGRLRVARLDGELRRTEPDRAVTGWGGLAPLGAELVAWQGQPWLVWMTYDTRYGGDRAVYAVPLTEEACLRTVPEPIVVLPGRGADLRGLGVAATDTDLWLAFGGEGFVEAHRFTASTP